MKPGPQREGPHGDSTGETSPRAQKELAGGSLTKELCMDSQTVGHPHDGVFEHPAMKQCGCYHAGKCQKHSAV